MESAEERKERLKELRQRAAASDAQEEEAQQPTSVEDNASGVVLKFRNYNVRDQKQIAHETVGHCQPCKKLDPL